MTEYVHSILGVEGRMFNRVPWPNGLLASQTWGASRDIKRRGERISVEVRFDDNCKNGRQSFAITGEIRDPKVRGDRGIISCGCIHDDIARHFPELAPLIKWHLTDTGGPMHYLSNTVYLAGDRDCWGLRNGEARQLRNGKTGLPSWRLEARTLMGQPVEMHKLQTYVDSETQPKMPYYFEYVPWNRVGEGKERELDKARAAAVWPEATDEDLCMEPDALRATLIARLPGLLAEFRTAMVDVCGFEWRELP